MGHGAGLRRRQSEVVEAILVGAARARPVMQRVASLTIAPRTQWPAMRSSRAAERPPRSSRRAEQSSHDVRARAGRARCAHVPLRCCWCNEAQAAGPPNRPAVTGSDGARRTCRARRLQRTVSAAVARQLRGAAACSPASSGDSTTRHGVVQWSTASRADGADLRWVAVHTRHEVQHHLADVRAQVADHKEDE